jgi:hypothetical protein
VAIDKCFGLTLGPASLYPTLLLLVQSGVRNTEGNGTKYNGRQVHADSCIWTLGSHYALIGLIANVASRQAN